MNSTVQKVSIKSRSRSLFDGFDDDPPEQLHVDLRSQYRTQAQVCLLRTALANGSVTTDDVQRKIELPAGINPSNLGLAVNQLRRAGIIKEGGVTNTTRPEGTHRLIRVWQVVDRLAAQLWLDANGGAA